VVFVASGEDVRHKKKHATSDVTPRK
jgi:hypothetical protein